MKLTILGSTGSIGVSALAAAQRLGYTISALVAGSNARLLEQQARLFAPAKVALFDSSAAADLRIRLADTPTVVLGGCEGVLEVAGAPTDVCLNSIVGIAGLLPTMAAIEGGCGRLALANKETLVCAGTTVLSEAKRRGVTVIPVDSEHSAIFQCIVGQDKSAVRKVILTASGGPFYGYDAERLRGVTVAETLSHPNWSMGKKITVDSATLMNKGLEFIEAMRLFNLTPDQIQVVVHRQSIVHSMVEFCDGAVMAQLGLPDMTIPIQYALTYPRRVATPVAAPDFGKISELSFFAPDLDTFICLKLAMAAAGKGEAACAALNGANEAAVAAFLEGRIPFYAIAEVVEAASEGYSGDAHPSTALAIDGEVRRKAATIIGGNYH